MPADLKRMWERLFTDPDARVVMHNGMNFDRRVFASNGFGEIPAEKVIDTMVLAYEHALPGSLESLCEAFRLDADHTKDKDGKRLIQIFCKPLPKNYKLTRATPQTHPAEWERFKNYARLDIESMRVIYKKLPKWNATAQERRLQALDAVINSRGMCIDLELAKGAVATAARHRTHLAARTRELTGGAVSAATQRDALLEYLRAEWGLDLVSATRAEVEKRIAEPGIPELVKDLLRVRIASTKISVQKFQSVLNAACEDGRLRGCLQFRGASRTGRFSGRIFQPQNLARPTMRNDEIEFAIEATKGGLLDTFYEDPMPVLSNLLRGLIIAPRGKKLVVADYSNVEGRVLAWLAGEEWKLKAFRDFDTGVGHDLYKLTYARAFNVKPETVTKAQRQMGKVLELGMGYGGGAGAFRTFALAYGIDLHDMADAVKSSISPAIWAEACEWYPKALLGGFTEGMDKEVFLACDSVKRAWRKANAQIVQFWHDMDAGVRQAVIEGGPVRVGRYITVDKKGNYLRVRLPSGRYLVYPSPRIDDDGISYFGVAQVSRKWARIRSWGGKYCIAKGTPVLTQEGWRPIEAITAADKVWDGVAWVQQSGVVCNGQKFCIKAYGVWMTPDHKVLTTEGWKDAKDHSRFNRVPCRLPDSVALCWDGRKESAVETRCICGRHKVVQGTELTRMAKRGITASCGCKRAETIARKNRTHGMSKHPAFGVWHSMKQRCEDPRHPAYKNYGGRGITVCPEWEHSFKAFWADMGATWKKGLDLDRINNDAGYSRENCRWATRKVNCNNRRRTRKVDGKPLTQWSAETGIGLTTLYYRLAHGVPRGQLFAKPDVSRRFTTSPTAAPATASSSSAKKAL